jgi:hypothetical protein
VLGDALAQLVEPLPRRRRYLRRARETVGKPPTLELGDEVDLVQDELARQVGRSDFDENVLAQRQAAALTQAGVPPAS